MTEFEDIGEELEWAHDRTDPVVPDNSTDVGDN